MVFLYINFEKTDVAFSLFGVFLFAVALVTVSMMPLASGYEIDLYAAFPLFFWFVLGAVYLFSLLLVLRRVFFDVKNRCWVIGVLLIICVNSLILILPVLRGYYFYGITDSAQFFGLTKDIQTYSNISSDLSLLPLNTYEPFSNLYPGFSILFVSVGYLTSLDIRLISMFAPCFFFMFYQLGLFVLAQSVTNSFRKALLTLAFSFPLLFLYLQSMCTPTVLLFLYSPFVVFIVYRLLTAKSNSFSWLLLIVPVLLSLPIAHPVDVFSIAILLLGITLIQHFYANKIGHAWYIFLILSIVWFIWTTVVGVFSQGVNSLIQRTSIGELSTYIEVAEQANAGAFDLVERFLIGFGQEAEYIALSGVIIIILVISSRRKKISFEYFFPMLILIVFLLLLPVFEFIPSIGSFRRMLFYAVLGATLLNGFYCYDCFTRVRFKKFSVPFLTIVIFGALLLGLFNVHASPLTRQYNQQITSMDVVGFSWFTTYNNGQSQICQIRVMQYALSSISTGIRETPRNIRWGTNDQYQAPDHFGYGTYDQYGNNFSDDTYFLTNKLDRLLLPVVFADYQSSWRWNDLDWQNLLDDPSVLRVYDNSEFTVSYVKGSG